MCEVINISEQVQEADNNMVHCQYGHHDVDQSNFSPYGLTAVQTICRSCMMVRKNKYREKNPDRYRKKYAQYMRDYRKKRSGSDSSDSD